MKWGLLSTANINEKLLGGVGGTEEATVVAVASRDRSRAEAFARDHGIERALGSYEELLEDPEGQRADSRVGEEPPRLGAEDALAQARTIEALYAAAESGRAVSL